MPRNISDEAGPRRVEVSLPGRGYDILIGRSLLTSSYPRISGLLRSEKVFIVCDENVQEPHAATLINHWKSEGLETELLVMPAGERTKDVRHLSEIWDKLTAGRYGRDAALVALGGGVIGDLAGFAAATYLRGIDLIQVPTSLLAMVDSSVGGKTGINHAAGKNLIGAFWQPKVVLIDVDVLSTLPGEEYISALAEVIKYGVIYDSAFFDWTEAHVDSLRRGEESAITQAVARSCEIKADVVSKDERESGVREILNFGHTVGHAIENVSGYGELKHGEAIAIGMVAESHLATTARPGWTEEQHDRLVKVIASAGLPVWLPRPIAAGELLNAAKSDKKARRGAIRYVLPHRFGKVETSPIEDGEVLRSLLEIGASER